MAMTQCSAVDSPSTSRKISFAGRSAVAGKSEKETQRRIDSFMFFLPPPMTVKEETSDGHTAATNQMSTTRQQEETILSLNLTTDGAGRTKLPTKTGTFWAWVSAHQARSFRFPKRQFGKSKLVFRSFPVSWFDSWQWLHYVKTKTR